MTITIDTLEDAKELLREGWTKRSFAVNAQQQSVDELDPTAVCFCLMGSIRRAAYDRHGYVFALRREEISVLSPAFPGLSNEPNELFQAISRYNDEEARSVDDVIAKIDIAITHMKETRK